MRLLDRYILKEYLSLFSAVFSVLLLFSLCQKWVSLLSKAVAGSLSLKVVTITLFLTVPELLTVLVPFTVLLSTLLLLGRQSVDNERVSMHALGISPLHIFRVLLKPVGVVVILLCGLTLYELPRIQQYKETYLAQQGQALLWENIVAGRFHVTPDGLTVFYAEKHDAVEKVEQGIFIFEAPKGMPGADNPWEVVSAKTGYWSYQNEQSPYLILETGWRYEGVPGQADYVRLRFARFGRKIGITPIEVPELRRTRHTSVLWHSEDKGDTAELQYRVSLPLAALLLCFIAVPLGAVQPRQGKFARLLPGILLFLLYFNLLSVCRRYIENEILPVWIGLWWVHLIMIAGTGWAWRKQLRR